MSSIHAIVPPRLARPMDYASSLARLLRGLRAFLPSITTTRRSYERQAEVFRRLGNAQKDLVLARAYYDAADVLANLAKA